MKKLSNTEADLKKELLIKKACIAAVFCTSIIFICRTQKMKDIFSKCDQVCNNLWI